MIFRWALMGQPCLVWNNLWKNRQVEQNLKFNRIDSENWLTDIDSNKEEEEDFA